MSRHATTAAINTGNVEHALVHVIKTAFAGYISAAVDVPLDFGLMVLL